MAEAMAVKNGRLLKLGSSAADILALRGPQTKIIDLLWQARDARADRFARAFHRRPPL